MRKLDLTNEYQQDAKKILDILFTQLKYQRLKNRITQKQIADSTGLSVSYISKLENGRYPTRLVWFVAYDMKVSENSPPKILE